MNDYYGNFIYNKKEINKCIIYDFENYNKEFIIKIINELRNINIILDEYSITGWNLIYYKDIKNNINNKIKLYTNYNYYKLYMEKYFIQIDNIFDIMFNIFKYLEKNIL